MTHKSDDAAHPSYYSPDSIEAIVAIKAWLPPKEYIGGLRFNAIKYLSRMGQKPGNSALKDARKALDYLRWLVEALEEEEAKSKAKEAHRVALMPSGKTLFVEAETGAMPLANTIRFSEKPEAQLNLKKFNWMAGTPGAKR